MSVTTSTIPTPPLPQPTKPQTLSQPLNPTTRPTSPNTPSREKRSASLKQTYKQLDPTVSWTSSIARHCRNGRLSEAAALFARMRLAGVEPNHVTLITLLSGCADFPLDVLCFGASVHGYARKLGLDRDNVMTGTAIVDMYAKCGRMDFARLAFDDLGAKNAVTWNTLIDGYMRNGEVDCAVEVFEEMPEKDAVSWTALIGGFIRSKKLEESLEWFREMQISGVKPDYVTMIAVLDSCAQLGTLGLGLWTNKFIMNEDYKDNIRINNSLIDMYSRCGCIQFARQVFEKMPDRTLVSWNSIIVGFAINGHAEEALEFFELLQKEGFKPDGVSFTGALTACSHAGLVDKGLEFFNSMKRIHRIKPRIEHYGCIVDLYSRAGRLEDALHVIETMSIKPNEVVIGSLLAACRTHGDVSLAERLMKYLFELDPGGDSNYVLLANMYAAVGRWDGAGKVRKKMKALGVQKTPGLSSIEIDCNIHEFVAGDKSHVDTQCMYEMLELLSLELKACGYITQNIETNRYEND